MRLQLKVVCIGFMAPVPAESTCQCIGLAVFYLPAVRYLPRIGCGWTYCSCSKGEAGRKVDVHLCNSWVYDGILCSVLSQSGGHSDGCLACLHSTDIYCHRGVIYTVNFVGRYLV